MSVLDLQPETGETGSLSQNTFKSGIDSTDIKGFSIYTPVSPVSLDETENNPSAQRSGLSEGELEAKLDEQETWNAESAEQTDLFD